MSNIFINKSFYYTSPFSVTKTASFMIVAVLLAILQTNNFTDLSNINATFFGSQLESTLPIPIRYLVHERSASLERK